MRTVIFFVDKKNKTFTKGLRLSSGQISFYGSEFCGTWKLENLNEIIKTYLENGDNVRIVNN